MATVVSGVSQTADHELPLPRRGRVGIGRERGRERRGKGEKGREREREGGESGEGGREGGERWEGGREREREREGGESGEGGRERARDRDRDTCST